MTTLVYLRISDDPSLEGLGVSRQREDVLDLCASRGWTVTDSDIRSENDASATRGRRPVFESLLIEIAAGDVKRVVAWSSERLWKGQHDQVRLFEACKANSVSLIFCKSPDIDLATPGGRLVAEVMGAAARMENDLKVERQVAAMRQHAKLGRRAGGGQRPFGYVLTYSQKHAGKRRVESMTVHDEEAAVIREVAERLLSGERLGAVAADLSARGVVGVSGVPMSPRTLRRIMCSARISGRRELKPVSTYEKSRPLVGEIMSDHADWQGIIDAETSDRLRTLLTDPAKRAKFSGTGRVYLASGILKCGRCGNGLSGVVHHTRKDGSTASRYLCAVQRQGKGCNGTATDVERTDEIVRDLVLVALDSAEMHERLTKRAEIDATLQPAIDADALTLQELAEDFAADRITRAEWLTARDVVAVRMQANERKLEAQRLALPLTAFVGSYDTMLKRWQGMTVDQQRVILSCVIERIDVNPAAPGRLFDPDRFSDPVWRV